MTHFISNARRSTICAGLLLLGFAASNLTASNAGEFSNWFLGKTGTGAQKCDWLGCQCPHCYDAKCKPCTPKVCLECPDPYCKKPMPCIPKQCTPCCPDYCPKPKPCLPPFCPPEKVGTGK